ncbi:uncharacterized protein [Centruroides vittatus]|uniref:uncharacterized protein n=1 Tax=Centruroides vittatus TaxID=120091 RepID=UPI0035107CA2
MTDRLSWHLESTYKLNDFQFGFRHQKSTANAITTVVDKINSLLENNTYVLSLSLDISKAFDSAWWPLIQYQLRNFSCPGNIYQLCCNYLKHREATFSIGPLNFHREVQRGCPQGSVCGPLFWVILFECFLCQDFGQDLSVAYADDAFLLFGGKSRADLENKGNFALDKIYEWGLNHKLAFNASKSKAIVFNRAGQRNLYARVPTLHMNGKKIKVVRELKYLGIMLDHSLTWNSHIQYITTHTSSIMHAFAKVAKTNWGLGASAMTAIYDSIFIPVLTYGCGVWGCAANKVHQKRKLISAQRRALLLITKAYRTIPNVCLQVLACKPPIDQYINFLQKIWYIKLGHPPSTQSSHFTDEALEVDIPFSHTLRHYTSFKFISGYPTDCDVTIYTDGSKREHLVGSSFVAYRDGLEIYHDLFRLGPLCSIYQAELFAILQALKWSDRVVSNGKITVITDSFSSITAIINNIDHPLVYDIQCVLLNSDNTYYFSWIHSHNGVIGNDRADELAKIAAEELANAIDYNSISIKVLKAILWNEMILTWQTAWDVNTSLTKRFFPDISKRLRNNWININHHNVQFFTGHGRFNSYLTRFTSCENDLCLVCEVTNSSLHYIYDCPMVECERHFLRTLLDEKNLQWPCEPCNLICDKEVYDQFEKLIDNYFRLTAIT